MPQLYRVGSYLVFIWVNENDPLEPIHVHVCEGTPQKDATKIWITKNGKAYVCHNRSKIPTHMMTNIKKTVEANVQLIEQKWIELFGEIRYYM